MYKRQKKNIGGIVIGLLIQITMTARGRLAPIIKHMNIVINVWIGRGIKAQNIPMPTARDIEFLLRWNRFGWSKKGCSHLG